MLLQKESIRGLCASAIGRTNTYLSSLKPVGEYILYCILVYVIVTLHSNMEDIYVDVEM